MKYQLLYLIIFIFLSACSSGPLSTRHPASEQYLDIVFDLDWTLIAQVKNTQGVPADELVYFEDELYRIAPGVREMMLRLMSFPNVRFSFFSGGGRERNLSVLGQIDLGGKRGVLLDHAYKVLSREDLTDLSAEVALDARFSERYKKDLRKINSDLSKVIMIDDNYLFAPTPKQRAHYLWLGETFENLETYSGQAASKIEAKYRPKGYKQWLSSRLKIPLVALIIEELLRENRDSWDVARLQKLSKEAQLEGSSWSRLKSKALIQARDLSPRNCSEHIELLLN